MKNKSPIIIEDDNSKNNYLYKIIKWLLDSIKSFFKLGWMPYNHIYYNSINLLFLDFINII